MFILIGLVIGFMASLPPGPINIYSLSQALRFGFWKSVSIRLTVAILDTLYCYLAIVFTSLLLSFLDRWSFILRLAGSAAIVVAGIHLLHLARTHRVLGLGLPENNNEIEKNKKVSHPIFFTFIMYISSPTLPVFWLTVATIVTSHGLISHHGIKPFFFGLACGLGSLIYYMIVAWIGHKLQQVMKPKTFEVIYTVMAWALFLLSAFNLFGYFLSPYKFNPRF
ncbi:MAG: LysE family transporter [Candidatus Aminicenantes bacterium]|nr:LysE family transporter [Candidatus Aminicenantes bacterium]